MKILPIHRCIDKKTVQVSSGSSNGSSNSTPS